MAGPDALDDHFQPGYGYSLEHVLHVLGVDEGVVDGHNVHHGVLDGRTENQAPDAAEAVDAHRHGAHRLVQNRRAEGGGARGGECEAGTHTTAQAGGGGRNADDLRRDARKPYDISGSGTSRTKTDKL